MLNDRRSSPVCCCSGDRFCVGVERSSSISVRPHRRSDSKASRESASLGPSGAIWRQETGGAPPIRGAVGSPRTISLLVWAIPVHNRPIERTTSRKTRILWVLHPAPLSVLHRFRSGVQPAMKRALAISLVICFVLLLSAGSSQATWISIYSSEQGGQEFDVVVTLETFGVTFNRSKKSRSC